MDNTNASLTVQKDLMLHASIQTALNVNGNAITATNRQAHSRVADMILKPEVGT